MSCQREHTSGGFTLIEVMISMLFLAFIVGELAMISVYAQNSSARARRITEANTLAEAVLEKSRNTTYNNVIGPFRDNPPPADPILFDLNRDGTLEKFEEVCTSNTPQRTTCSCSAGIYSIERIVEQYLPVTPVPHKDTEAVDISVTVTWVNEKGIAEQIALKTVRSRS